MASIHKLVIKSPFCDLFPIDENLVKAIAADMRRNQYDETRPIVLWRGKNIVIDGHTRVKAAQLAGRHFVPHAEKTFKDEEGALRYAIHNQRNRRNMTEADLLRCIEAVDKRRGRGKGQHRVGGKFQPKAPNGTTGRSAEETARIVGTSARKVNRARRVLSDPKEREEVMAGKKTIHQASQDVKKKRTQKPQRDEKGKFTVREDRRQAILAEAYNELRIWRKKYKNYQELEAIFDVLDREIP